MGAMIRRMIVIAAVALTGSGCHHADFNPALARSPYPYELHTTETAQAEVFRDGTSISIVNATANSWMSPIIWVNQQYSMPVSELSAGQTLALDLRQFRDDLGETFPAGGLFATRKTMPVRLVELQAAPGEPLIGLVAIRRVDYE